MKQPIPVRKNDDISLQIDAISAEGQGVGRINGFAVFVPGALAGEAVRAHVIKVMSNCAIAKLQAVETPSPHRVLPVCPVYASCGGCALQHLAYPEQLRVKRQTVIDALARIGGIAAPDVKETIGMADPWRYRNKGSFPFAAIDGAVRFGFFAERSHRLVPFTDCMIQDARLTDIANRVAEWANTYAVPAYDEGTRAGVLRHVVARTTADGGTMAVIVTTTKTLRHADALLELLPQVTSVWHNTNPADTNVIFGPGFRLLAGEPALQETIAAHIFSVSPQSFLQVNATQTARLYGEAVRLLDPREDECIVDAYCGIGTLSLLAARHAKRVIGIESVPEAILDAKQNAEKNGLPNAEFRLGAVETVLPQLIREGTPIDAVLLDPPRKGAEKSALEALCASGARRAVYVSCNPATLARDVKILTAGGFTLVTAQ
ncbi:MAG: 23S rRNA (uracil(1939)-C(5))-methyltransferase RlmD, partial [Clostridia bacterium]|nr:23S rRNA (uracil(1939)-C(5))-methyltransferase RlmD [Clostridia bacterium]